MGSLGGEEGLPHEGCNNERFCCQQRCDGTFGVVPIEPIQKLLHPWLFPSDIAGHATVCLTEKFIPKCHGPQQLLASFDCPQLTQ
ncbi:hypothetical protein QQF64_021465 [Cirrhinus molitorella]|uniref:Uncharacterized protein n=1 Tax=Cirrhinus molitorella TaxID=172907 RepID=A0ABR3LC19_9TELE